MTARDKWIQNSKKLQNLRHLKKKTTFDNINTK